jgi:hypothetical protein
MANVPLIDERTANAWGWILRIFEGEPTGDLAFDVGEYRLFSTQLALIYAS